MVPLILTIGFLFIQVQGGHRLDNHSEVTKGHDWGYYSFNVAWDERPVHWKDFFPQCGGKRQSPVHIHKNHVKYDPEIGQLQFQGYETMPTANFTMSNNGHSLQFKVHSDHYISGGGLDGRYKLAQFHFHWGSGNDNGSEHWVDDRHYAAETHLVHFKTEYGTFENSLEKPDGLAVLGSIMAVEGYDNPNLTDIVRHLPDVAYADSPPTQVKSFPLRFMLPMDHRVFYRYNGSLTTPPCYESVIWTVFENPITLSQVQIDRLRAELHHSVQAETGTSEDYALVDNHRMPQVLHGRGIYTNRPEGTTTLQDEYTGAAALVTATTTTIIMTLTSFLLQ